MMAEKITVHKASPAAAREVAEMVGELLDEIMTAVGVRVFDFDLNETVARLEDFIARDKYFVFVARKAGGDAIGFVTLYECHALYAGGAFGTLPEFYVRPDYRSMKVGFRLVSQAKSFGISRGWKRLEVTTPPLPQFDRTLAFYEREGFTITGGRKLKVVL